MMTIAGNGSVGIGTAAPQSGLHVSDSTGFGIVLERNSTQGRTPRIQLIDTSQGSVTSAPVWGIDNSRDAFRIYRQPNLTTAGASIIHISNSGLVGIGTTQPTFQLQVSGTGYFTDLVRAPKVAAGQDESDNRALVTKRSNVDGIDLIQMRSGGTLAFPILIGRLDEVGFYTNGRLNGVKTLSPTTALHVNGILRIATDIDACDADRRGAIKYEGSDFFICRNGTTWETLVAGVGGSVVTDRIVSGTTTMIAYPASNGIDGAVQLTANQLPARSNLQLINNSSTARLQLSGETSTSTAIGFNRIGEATFATIAGTQTANGAGDLVFSTDDGVAHAERMRINSLGYVGIGTPSPTAPLHVMGNMNIESITNDNAGAGLGFFKSRAGGAALKDDRLIGLYGQGHNGTAYSGNVVAIEALAAEDFTTGAHGTWIRMGTTPRGSIARNSNRWILSPDGLMGISLPSIEPSATIHIRGSIRLGTEISATLNVCNTNRTGAIKYESGDFFLCRNGTAWESLTGLTDGSTAASDRITSGTTQVITRNNTSVSIVTAGTERVVVGTTGNVGIGQQPVSGVALATSGTSRFSSNMTVTGNNAVDATNGYVLRLGSNPDISFLDNSKGGADMYFDGHGYISSQYSTYSNISVSQSTPTGGAFVWGAFRPVRTSGTELMRLNDSGELGIGTASPSSSLHVSNDRAADTSILITNKSNDPLASAYFGANADIASFQLRANSSQASSTAQLGLPSGVVLFTNSGATGGITLSARNAAAPINFVAGNAQRMRLAANGYLGIGTDNPSRSLHVVGGEIQTSSSGDVCNTDRAGAIRYSGGNLSYCNGTA
ncbi:MAG: hypothetical protein EON60_12400, partial [Alphaproteobacteria bacterium]